MSKKFKGTVILSVAIVVASVSLYGVFRLFQQQKGASGLELDPNATVGILPGTDLEARKLQLQEQLDNSKIAFSINTSPLFDKKTGEGNLLLENPQNNAKLLTAELVLDESKQVIYSSKAIAPGSYLQTVKLDKKLGAGTYNATVYLKAYDLETQDIIGQTGAAVILTVT